MSPEQRPALRADAALVAALFAVDPVGLGGVALRSPAGPLRDTWLALLRQCLPEATPWLRVPHHATDAALLGGLDLAATLHAGRPVAQRGLLARADHAAGGVLLLAMAERASPGVASHLAAVLDTHEAVLERDGLTDRRPARLGLVALDEGAGDEEQMPAALLDRQAFHLPLVLAGPDDGEATDWQRRDIEQARALLSQVKVPEGLVQALCGAALAWGVVSLRAPLLALRAARAAAALAGFDEVDDTHAAVAARLVLAPRATRLPSSAPAEEEDTQAPQSTEATDPPDADEAPPPPPDTAPESPEPDTAGDQPIDPTAMEDQLIEAVHAVIPAGLLAALQLGQARQARAQAAGRAGAVQK
ncbi:MAG: magnesium chelatase ATPase subunit D, partial [Comamonadaceae bacterium]